jgi:cytochrome P450
MAGLLARETRSWVRGVAGLTTPGQAVSSAVRTTQASTVDTVRVGFGVLLPLVAQGPVIRRALVTALAARHGWDRHAGRVLADLRRRYDGGPVLLRIPGRRVALVLRRDDVGRLLRQSPEPFAAATREKVAALGHFQPHGVLISTGEVRQRRRDFNETVLDTGQVMHRLAATIDRIVDDEIRALVETDRPGLGWPAFAATHDRIVRRIVLGDRAGNDTHLTEVMDRLRRRGNWAYGQPIAPALRRALVSRLERYLAAAEAESLAAVIAATPTSMDVDPHGQVPHWLFAYDALGATVFRALAALAVDDAARSLVDSELAPGLAHRPALSALVLDALRLWPTTLVVLREAAEPTEWPGGELPAGTTLVVVSSFFHRDSDALSGANRLDLRSWMDGDFDADPGIVPFSAGPVRCPGRDLVVFTGATTLAALLRRRDVALVNPRLDPVHLPTELDHFRIHLRLHPRR